MIFMLPIITAISEIVSTAAALLPKIIEVVGKNILEFAQILSGIMKGLGLIKPDEEVTDLGDKALQAADDGITPEKYDTHEEYLKAIEDFDLDPEKSKDIDDGKKLEKGVEVITATLVERYGEVMGDFLLLIGKNQPYFLERMPLITTVVRDSLANFGDIVRYIQGTETDTKKSNDTLRVLYDVEKRVNPEATIDDLMNNIEKLND